MLDLSLVWYATHTPKVAQNVLFISVWEIVLKLDNHAFEKCAGKKKNLAY